MRYDASGRDVGGDVIAAVVRAAFVVSNVFAVVFILNMTALRGAMRLYDNRVMVEHTREVRQQIREVYLTLLEAESASRGYVLSRDDEFRRLYGTYESATWWGLSTLRRLTADNPSQQARCDDLAAALKDKFAFLRSVMSSGMHARVDLDRGRHLLVRLAHVLNDMDAEEMRLYFARDRTMSKTIKIIYTCMILILIRDVIALAMILVSGIKVYAQERGARRRARPGPSGGLVG